MTVSFKSLFNRKISKTQSKDAGLALTLVFLLIGYFTILDWPLKFGIIFLIIDMIWPSFFRPFAWFWFGFADILGRFTSTIILSIVFFVVVTPVGLLRRIIGKDNLKLKNFKKDNHSVLTNRDHVYNKKDLEQPF